MWSKLFIGFESAGEDPRPDCEAVFWGGSGPGLEQEPQLTGRLHPQGSQREVHLSGQYAYTHPL